MDDAVLEVGVSPKVGPVRGVVTVPVLVLVAGGRMQVKNRVDACSGALFDDCVQAREPLLLQRERCGVVLEMVVAEGDAQAVNAQRGEVAGVGLREEVCKETFEERIGGLGAQDPGQGPALLGLGAWVAGDEILHGHPAAQTQSAQQHGSTGVVDDLVSTDVERSCDAHEFPLGR